MEEGHSKNLSTWAKNLEDGIFDSETQNDAEFIQRILVEVLGYVGSSAGQSWSVAKNEPVGSGNVDVALGKFSSNSPSEIMAPFELKGAKTKFLDAVMPGRHKSPVQQAWERDYITKTFNQTRGNWDLYIAFLELGCNLLSPVGYLSFITPDKWISKDFGVEIRKRIMPGILSILPVGRDVFESALVDSIVTTISDSISAAMEGKLSAEVITLPKAFMR